MPRDIEMMFAGEELGHESGRTVIAVIGIDRYQHWKPLSNAVRDARGAAALFERLGFEQVTAALIDGLATGPAIQSLVSDELATLGPHDSLVIFYAGHGITRTHRVGDQVIKTGYLIPVDAHGKVSSWIDLQGWLRAVSVLPPRHILVILDACQSGIALDPACGWRGTALHHDESLAALRARRSRRIITSALDDQVAHDGGPVHGHSLFTGCLIEALTHGAVGAGRRYVTSTELGLHLQQRVGTYPDCRQTPDFGAFGLDERGEMAIPLSPAPTPRPDAPEPPAPRGRGLPVALVVAAIAGGALLIASKTIAPASQVRSATADPEPLGPLPSCPPDMVPIPGGIFEMGSKDRQGYDNERPSHEVILSPYCIDRTEVTVKAYEACVNGNGCTSSLGTAQWAGASTEDLKMWSWFCNDGHRPDHPINCITWFQADAYCKLNGRRLPTEAEWEFAARGKDGRKWPWGSAVEPNAQLVNACGLECEEYGKRQLNKKWPPLYQQDDHWISTAPVGSFPAGASPFGALDMAGNVFEWTADWYAKKYPESVEPDPPGPPTGDERVIRGGGWQYWDQNRVTTTFRLNISPSVRCQNIGFRCALATDVTTISPDR